MKIEFYTEKAYGSRLIGEYECLPIQNMKDTDEIPLKMTDIANELPNMFENMQTLLLETDEKFRKCVERQPKMAAKYKNSSHYCFRYKNIGLSSHAIIVLIHNSVKKQNKLLHYYVPVDSVLKITVVPEKCSVCRAEDSFINKIETKQGTILECLNCKDKQKKWTDEYEKKRKLADYYSPWNEFLCDSCESYGHECRDCRSFYKDMRNDMY